jgi:hypothetical protein
VGRRVDDAIERDVVRALGPAARAGVVPDQGFMADPGPPPVSTSPGEWVISEPRCIAILVRLYGWRVTEAGVLRRVRPVARLAAIPRLKDHLPPEELALVESDRSIADLAAAAAADVA